MNLSIIIPAYQEALRIPRSLVALAAFLRSRDFGAVEVIVVVSPSPDGTPGLVRESSGLFDSLKVIESGEGSLKGQNVQIGMLAASGSRRVFMDADLATPLHHLDEVFRLMDAGAGVVVGVRDLHSSHTGVRRLISQVGNFLVRVLLLPGISDSQCGFKAFSSDAASRIFVRQKTRGWGFDMEILAWARRFGYLVAVVPIPDWADIEGGTLHQHPLAAALRTLKDLARIRLRLWLTR